MASLQFEHLPREVLLAIMQHVPLPFLHSLVYASPAAARIFDAYGVAILEAAMTATLPDQIQDIIRLVAMVRSSAVECRSLGEFSRLYIGPEASDFPPPLSMDLSPAILRGMLVTAWQVWCLTHACLQHYIDRCMALQPSHLVDPTFEFGIKAPPWQEQPAGKRYQPRNAGPPSWVEEQRVARAFWQVQMLYDLRKAAVQGQLGWPQDDLDRLHWLDAATFWRATGVQAEQIWAVMEYIDEMETKGGCSAQKPPWPVREVTVRWPTPEPVSQDASGLDWEQDAVHLDKETPGYRCVGLLAGHARSPLRYVTFAPFSRLGFAFWDLKRLCALELVDPPPKSVGSFVPYGRLAFTWCSILSKEDLAEVQRIAQARTEEVNRGLYQAMLDQLVRREMRLAGAGQQAGG
ncbi:hypothetical protein VTN77DRAFT_7278 [Rasamsonia byssochlamydoides]|uniref:uncharacterized protein n=1 Tax=Rasamsonia byssochlamydoides TaxID=89139 RepID=UPI003742A836